MKNEERQEEKIEGKKNEKERKKEKVRIDDVGGSTRCNSATRSNNRTSGKAILVTASNW